MARRIRLTILSVAALAVLLATAPPQGLVHQLLDDAAENLTEQFRAVGMMEAGDTTRVKVDVDGSSRYWAVAVCDGDCLDVDLEIRDVEGQLIAADFLRDDVPIVTVDPIAAGPVVIEIAMIECDGLCEWGVVFGPS